MRHTRHVNKIHQTFEMSPKFNLHAILEKKKGVTVAPMAGLDGFGVMASGSW